ncbi:MAG: hypothetical protein KAG66_11915 [Methylococcales bacterium]|nr:hypothetical protein [Methylococcales bacterium]
MYFSQYNLTDQDVVQHIADNFTYPVKNNYHSNFLQLSRDVGSLEAIQTMVRIHYIVEHLTKSKQEAVKFETTIHGKNCLGVTPVGDALYRSLLQPHRFVTPPRQQLSEGLNAWEGVGQRIFGSTPIFQGNPMLPMNAQGVIEGELLNAFLIRLREATGRTLRQSERSLRRKDAQQAYNAKTKLVDRLKEHHPGLFGLSVALMYSQDYAGKVRLKDSAEHLQKLIDALKGDPWFGKSVGFMWTRHFLSEAGYRYNFVLLFDPEMTPVHTLNGSYVLQEWQASTKGAGLDYVLPDFFRNADELLHEIKCAKAAAQFIRLIPDEKFPHFGVSELPSTKSLSELEQEPPTNLGRDDFGGNHTQALNEAVNNRFS